MDVINNYKTRGVAPEIILGPNGRRIKSEASRMALLVPDGSSMSRVAAADAEDPADLTTLAQLQAATVFGSDPQYREVNTPASTTSATPVTYDTWSVTLLGGVYFITPMLVLGSSTTNTVVSGRVRVGADVEFSSTMRPQSTEGRFAVTGSIMKRLTAGSHTFVADFSRSSGTGNALASRFCLSLWRVAL